MSRCPKFGYSLVGKGISGTPAQLAALNSEGFDIEIAVYDVIGSDPFFGSGVSALMIYETLRGARDASVLVRINSPGGSTTEGFAIYNHLMEHPGRVVTRVDGLAASMASVIMLAGQEREIAFGGTVMIHNPFAFVEGEANELRGIADMLDRQKAEMLAIYSKRTSLSPARASKMVDATTWMGADEALDLGFATRVTGTPARMVAAALPGDLKNAPPHVRALLAAQAQEILTTLGTLSVEAEAPPGAPGKGSTPGSAVNMTEEEMKAIVAKAQADAQAAVDAISAKDKEIQALKAELAEAKAKFPNDDDEEDAKAKAETTAVVNAAAELTGEKDPAKIEGALMALADRRTPIPVRADTVASLIKDGKLPPARKAWALGCSQAALDHYLEGLGGQRVVPVGQEHRSDDDAGRARAGIDVSTVALTKDEIVICKQMGMDQKKFLEDKKASHLAGMSS